MYIWITRPMLNLRPGQSLIYGFTYINHKFWEDLNVVCLLYFNLLSDFDLYLELYTCNVIKSHMVLRIINVVWLVYFNVLSDLDLDLEVVKSHLEYYKIINIILYIIFVSYLIVL